jgi:hypothetical protein
MIHYRHCPTLVFVSPCHARRGGVLISVRFNRACQKDWYDEHINSEYKITLVLF